MTLTREILIEYWGHSQIGKVRVRGKEVDTVRVDKAFGDFCSKGEQEIGLKLKGGCGVRGRWLLRWEKYQHLFVCVLIGMI